MQAVAGLLPNLALAPSESFSINRVVISLLISKRKAKRRVTLQSDDVVIRIIEPKPSLFIHVAMGFSKNLDSIGVMEIYIVDKIFFFFLPLLHVECTVVWKATH